MKPTACLLMLGVVALFTNQAAAQPPALLSGQGDCAICATGLNGTGCNNTATFPAGSALLGVGGGGFQFASGNAFNFSVASPDASRFEVLFAKTTQPSLVYTYLSAVTNTTCFSSGMVYAPLLSDPCDAPYQLVILCKAAGTRNPANATNVGSCTIQYSIQAIKYNELCPLSPGPAPATFASAPTEQYNFQPFIDQLQQIGNTPGGAGAIVTPIGASAPMPSTSLSGCVCTCCTGTGCTPTQAAFATNSAASCSASACRSQFPSLCPAAGSAGIVSGTFLAANAPAPAPNSAMAGASISAAAFVGVAALMALLF